MVALRLTHKHFILCPSNLEFIAAGELSSTRQLSGQFLIIIIIIIIITIT